MSSGSLAGATSSRVDSASKHIQACRVSTEFFIQSLSGQVDNPQAELENNKMKYCLHKDEFVIGLGRPMYGSSSIVTRKKAYPSVISNMGRMHECTLRWLAMHNFLATDSYTMTEIKKRIQGVIQDTNDIPGIEKGALKNENVERIWLDQINNMTGFYFVGVSLGQAYAHANSGDPVVSVVGFLSLFLDFLSSFCVCVCVRRPGYHF